MTKGFQGRQCFSELSGFERSSANTIYIEIWNKIDVNKKLFLFRVLINDFERVLSTSGLENHISKWQSELKINLSFNPGGQKVNRANNDFQS